MLNFEDWLEDYSAWRDPNNIFYQGDNPEMSKFQKGGTNPADSSPTKIMPGGTQDSIGSQSTVISKNIAQQIHSISSELQDVKNRLGGLERMIKKSA